MIRRPVELVAHIFGVDEVARAMLHGGAVVLRMRYESIPAVVRNVEPLVPVGGPGICQLGAREQVAMRRLGAPASPSRLTSHPARASSACRAAARQVTWAIWHPVTRA